MDPLLPRRNIDGRQRQFTPEEVDALADFVWRFRGFKDAVVARLAATRRRRPMTPRLTDQPRLSSGEDGVSI